MRSFELPRCRQRGPEFFPGRCMCRSSRIVAFQGATADLCANVCPHVDHDGDRAVPPLWTAGGSGYGVAIGTYDSLHRPQRRFGTEAVEINLAALRGNCGPHLKILVCDDASPRSSQRRYRELCAQYGAEFSSNRKRM